MELFSFCSKRVQGCFFLLALLCSVPVLSVAQDFPERSSTLVTDFTNTLSASEKQALEQKLVAFNDSSSTQITVVIMNSVGSYDINDYAAKLGEKWGVGQKGKNNGVVLLVALQDRKVSIQVGYGLEGALTDALTKRIIEVELKPSFKEGQYYEGLDKATTALMLASAGEYTAPPVEKNRGSWVPFIVFAVILLFSVIRRTRRASMYASGNNVSFWTAMMLMNAGRGSSGGSWSNFNSGSGGFGGFGGGSFGGGGSSGSW